MSFDHINEVFQKLSLEERMADIKSAYNLAVTNSDLEVITSYEYVHEDARVAIRYRTKSYFMDIPLFAISELRWDIIGRCLEELESIHTKEQPNVRHLLTN